MPNIDKLFHANGFSDLANVESKKTWLAYWHSHELLVISKKQARVIWTWTLLSTSYWFPLEPGEEQWRSTLGKTACGAAFPFITNWLKLPTGTSTGLQQRTARKIQGPQYIYFFIPSWSPYLTQVNPTPTLGTAKNAVIPYFPGVAFSPPTFDFTNLSLLYSILFLSLPFAPSTLPLILCTTNCQHWPHRGATNTKDLLENGYLVVFCGRVPAKGQAPRCSLSFVVCLLGL